MKTLFKHTFIVSFALLAAFPLFAGGKKDSAQAGTSATSKQGAAAAEPIWLHNAESSYPQASYITAIGSGATQYESANEAKAALSQYLRQTVTAEVRLTVTASEIESSNQYISDVQSKSALHDITSIDTSNFYQAQDGTYYTLAVLSRQTAGKDLSSRISSRTKQIKQDAKNAQSAQGTFEGLRRAYRAAKNAIENDADISLLYLINASYYQSAIKEADYDSVAITRYAEDAASQITISVNANDASLAAALSRALQEYGLKVQSGGAAQYQVNGNSSVTVQESLNENKFARYTVNAALVESASGKELLNFEESGREGHLTQTDANRRAQAKAVSVAETRFKEELARLFE